ncbi:SAM domain-containing protein [Tieghemostelium lacteum]|uniref:ubiquitinyl hydrolase 1 n=1 Tax=Tieghemostelium lacteum TaxID=361077 RepID=A0A151ZAJ9_TIELA|nr:SAM domain-containing protein [Tieghemostelium lacteum]|eukprot:KYQ90967.1 SAM domain-containing protein [Tieghemostelium lacteum]
MATGTTVYWEKQVAALCAVHSLNTLLQGSYFTEVDLASIAHQLDSNERDVMMESGMGSNDFIKFVAEDSGNVSDDGNYSIQVLESALKSFNLTCQSINNKEIQDVIKNPLNETGFICHLQSHWFTLRKINNNWFNLNSLLKNGPEYLSNFYVSLFLETLRSDHWNIFVVRGTYPTIVPFSDAEHGKWLTVKNEPSKQSNNRPTQKSPFNVYDDDDEELKQALKYSLQYEDNLQDTQALKNRGVISTDQFNDLFSQFNNQHSQGGENRMYLNPRNNQTMNNDYVLLDDDDDDDEELKKAIAASLQQN